MLLGTGEVDTLSGTLWYTAVHNGTGLPAISVPIGGDSLPIGLQLTSRAGADQFLLSVAERVDQIVARSPSTP